MVEVDQEEKVKLGSDEVEIVKEFCYLGDNVRNRRRC